MEKLFNHHPDRSFAETLIRYIDEGAHIGFSGDHHELISPNWNSTLVYKSAVEKTLITDIELGRKSGPFAYPPVANFVGSPMGAFYKRNAPTRHVLYTT